MPRVPERSSSTCLRDAHTATCRTAQSIAASLILQDNTVNCCLYPAHPILGSLRKGGASFRKVRLRCIQLVWELTKREDCGPLILVNMPQAQESENHRFHRRSLCDPQLTIAVRGPWRSADPILGSRRTEELRSGKFDWCWIEPL
jgi:hypothetical protein